MNEHYQKNTTLREENVELTNKLKGLIEQYELREQVGNCSLVRRGIGQNFICLQFIIARRHHN